MAQVLAERLARRCERTVGYAVQPYDAALHAHVLRTQSSRLDLLAGCVGDSEARRAIAASLEGQSGAWWLDCGNSRGSSQVLLGSAPQRDLLHGPSMRGKGSVTLCPRRICNAPTSWL